MKFALEVLTCVMLDAAMLVFVFELVRKRAKGNASKRITSACMGLGFLICCISEVMRTDGYAVFVLGALGFMLSYTAFVFTFSQD